jgi:hypothetical protein
VILRKVYWAPGTLITPEHFLALERWAEALVVAAAGGPEGLFRTHVHIDWNPVNCAEPVATKASGRKVNLIFRRLLARTPRGQIIQLEECPVNDCPYEKVDDDKPLLVWLKPDDKLPAGLTGTEPVLYPLRVTAVVAPEPGPAGALVVAALKQSGGKLIDDPDFIPPCADVSACERVAKAATAALDELKGCAEKARAGRPDILACYRSVWPAISDPRCPPDRFLALLRWFLAECGEDEPEAPDTALNAAPAFQAVRTALTNLSRKLGPRAHATRTQEIAVKSVKPGGRRAKDFQGYVIELAKSLGVELTSRNASRFVVRLKYPDGAGKEFRCHSKKQALEIASEELADDPEEGWVRFEHTPDADEREQERVVFYLPKESDFNLEPTWSESVQIRGVK